MSPTPAGYEIRPPTPDDVDGITAMMLANDLADADESDFDADVLRDQWSSPGFEPSDDAWAIVDPNGTIVGYANVTSDGEAKLKSWGVSHPAHPGMGLGSALLDRIEARAAKRFEPGAGALFTAITDADASAEALVRSRGFEHVRTFRHLQIDLDGSPGDPGELPPGIEIRGITPEPDLPRIHAIFVEAFRGEWGYRPIPFQEWLGMEVETPNFDPSLWLLATEREEAVGALSGVVWGDRGWVGELGVRAAWRGRGIASALLRRAFTTFASRELPRVMLNVDSENSTGAVRLYERVGMRTVRGWDVYEKLVG
jgi:mycothiol synthase